MNRPINENVQNALSKMGVNYPKVKEVTYGTEIVVEGADDIEIEHLFEVADRTNKLSKVEEESVRVRFVFEDSFFANRFLEFAKARAETQEGMRVRKSIHPRPIVNETIVNEAIVNEAEYTKRRTGETVKIQDFNVGDKVRTPAGDAGTVVGMEGGHYRVKWTRGKNEGKTTSTSHDAITPFFVRQRREKKK